MYLPLLLAHSAQQLHQKDAAHITQISEVGLMLLLDKELFLSQEYGNVLESKRHLHLTHNQLQPAFHQP